MKSWYFILEILIPLSTSLDNTEFENEPGLEHGLQMTFPEPELVCGSGKTHYVGFSIKERLT